MSSLLNLYQPIVGASAVSLYLTLNDLAKNTETKVDHILLATLQERLDLDLMTIDKSKSKLEAVALIQTWKNKNDVLGEYYVFEMKPILAHDEFFDMVLLSNLLLEKVGAYQFNRLKKTINPEPINLFNNQQNISSSFFDVFHVNQDKVLESIENDNSTKTDSIVSTNDQQNIDWDYLAELLGVYQIGKQEINSHKKEFADLLSFYQLNEQELGRLIARSINRDDNKINVARLNSLANQIYLSDGQQVKVSPEKDSIELIKSLSKEDLKILDEIKELPPSKYLKKIKNDRYQGNVTSDELRTIRNISRNHDLSDDYINLLIKVSFESIAKNKQGTVDPIKLTQYTVEKILDSWKQNKADSVVKALIFVKNWDKNHKNNSNKSRYNNYPNKPLRREIATNWDKEKAVIPDDIDKKFEEAQKAMNELNNKKMEKNNG